MLTIFKNSEQGLQTIDRLANGSWVKVTDPTPDEIAVLVEMGVDMDLITYSLDMDEMARVERDEGYTFILLRIPYFQGEHNDIPYTTIPLGLILMDTYVVSVCKHENDIERILVNGKYRGDEDRQTLPFCPVCAARNRYPLPAPSARDQPHRGTS